MSSNAVASGGPSTVASSSTAAAAAAADDVPRVLARNNACHQCRKRKLKCDAIRPTCGNCSKPRIRGAHAGEPPAPCSWDPAQGGITKVAEGSNGRNGVASYGNGDSARQGKRARVDAQDEGPGGGAGYNTTDVPSGFMDVREGDKEMFEAGLAPRLSNASMTDLPPRIHSFPSFESNGSQHSSPMGALVWSDWPMDLPSQAVVDHMCTVFFDKVPTLPKMVHRATFMSALQLPPSNSRFPARPLLHAMLAISANHISESALASRAYFPVGTPSYFVNHPERDLSEANPSYGFGMYGSGGSHDTTSMAARSLASNFGPRGSANSALARFQLWHRRKAYETSPAYLDKGEQLVAIVQAHVIATTIDQYNAWWVDLWMESGTCMRMCIPLCLHETTDVHPESLDLKNRKRFLAPATDILEQAERDRTWWMVYLLDSSVAMTTVWPISMEEAEITVELPVVQSLYDGAIGRMKGTQELNAPDLFSNHPDIHADSFNLLIKAFRMRNDVGRFFRQYSRGSHSASKYASDPTLRTLLSRIHAFRLACPAHLRRPTQTMNEKGVRTMDVDLISAFMITHASSISLGEPLVNDESWTHDMARMALAAVRAVLSLMYEITATSFDLTLFPPYITWVWAQCVRCLCRFAEAAGKSGDTVSVSVFRAEIEVFRMALKQYGERYPTGARHLKICDDIFFAVAFSQDPTRALGYGCGMETVVDEGNNPWSKPGTGMKGNGDRASESSTPAGQSDSTRIRASSLTSASAGVSPPNALGSTNGSNGTAQFSINSDGAGPSTQSAPTHDFSMFGPTITANDLAPMLNNQHYTSPDLSNTTNGNGGLHDVHGSSNGFTWTSTTPFAAQSQTIPLSFPGGSLAGDTSNLFANGTAQFGQSGQGQQEQLLDFGFDISSFSYDLDSVANLFAGSQVTFDGQDFIWKT